MKVCIWRIH